MKTSLFLASLPFFFAPLALALSVGSPLPDVALKNQNGKMIRLSDYKGQFILVYFYPKDETPGCTTEACSFRDNYVKLKESNAVIFGISRQDEQSHKKFIARHKLPFDLLVDSDGSAAKAFGVGTVPVLGFTKRQSILFGPDGKAIRFYESVDPKTHVEEVLQDIQKASEVK
jgi:peroxiredoxin Q/BCP